MKTATFSHLQLRFRYLENFWCGIAVFGSPLTPPSFQWIWSCCFSQILNNLLISYPKMWRERLCYTEKNINKFQCLPKSKTKTTTKLDRFYVPRQNGLVSDIVRQKVFFVILLHVIRTLSKNPEKKLIGRDLWRYLWVDLKEKSLFVWESFCGCYRIWRTYSPQIR